MTENVGMFAHDRGPCIQVASGRLFYLLDPRPNEIHIEDISAHLSKLTRFTGATSDFYSVAQHSVICSYLVPPEHALTALLHDASEAYTNDISRPMKVALDTLAPGVLKRIEERLEHAVAARYGLTFPFPPCVKEADNVALSTERRDLMRPGHDWPHLPAPLPDVIEPLSPPEAELRFLVRFFSLKGTL